jgi:hypothetical protein
MHRAPTITQITDNKRQMSDISREGRNNGGERSTTNSRIYNEFHKREEKYFLL